jgi:hypothetical protein
VDWQFETQGVVINLEVKYKPYDWLRWVDAGRYALALQSYFDTVAEKFPCKMNGQVNLLAITLLGALGPELRAMTTSFLEAHPTLDGVLFWSIARRDSTAYECIFQPEARFIQSLLRPAEVEDCWRNPFIVLSAPDWRKLSAKDHADRAVLGQFCVEDQQR